VVICTSARIVRAWGRNNYAQTRVPAGLSGVTHVAAGESHSVALKSNGTVVEWGQVWQDWQYRPAKPPTGLINVIAIAAGKTHTLAIVRTTP